MKKPLKITSVLLLISMFVHAQPEIGGFTIITSEAQKEELETQKKLKNFAALVDFVVKKVDLPISEDKIMLFLGNSNFTAILKYPDFNTSITYGNKEGFYQNFSLDSDKIDVKKHPLFGVFTRLSTQNSEHKGRYIFYYSSRIFENSQVKELLGGYSNQNYIGTNALISKRKQLNNDKTPKADYENGLKFFEGSGQIKNYNTAINYLKAAADGGYTDAYVILSKLYSYGDYPWFNSDTDESLKYAQKALDLGSIAAYAQLGSIYQYTKKDFKTALRYYETGMEKGDIQSIGSLYSNYKTGSDLVKKNSSKAKEMAEKACEISQKLENPATYSYWCDLLKTN